MPFLRVRPGNTIAYRPGRNAAIKEHFERGVTIFTQHEQITRGPNGPYVSIGADIGLKTHFETEADLEAHTESFSRLLQDTLALEKVAEGFNPKTDDLRLIKPSSKKS